MESEVRVALDAVLRAAQQVERELSVCMQGRTAVSSVGRLEGSERSDAGPLLPSHQSSLSFTSVKGTRI